MTLFWDVAPYSTPETLVSFNQTTWHNIPEDSHLHARCHENLKCHHLSASFICDTTDSFLVKFGFEVH
jgi:hypothetical protein